jgi:hypothetical protein
MLVLGTVSLMWVGSGISGEVGSSSVDDLRSGDVVEERANQSEINQGEISGDSTQIDDGSIFGLIVTGLRSFVELATVVVLLPFELEKLGLPWWGAYPLGLLAQLIMSIVLIVVVMNRRIP